MARPTEKVCPSCGKKKRFSEYYVHRRFDKEYGCDPICKVCSKAMATTKEGLVNYCSTTSRPFLEDLWKWCEDKTAEKFDKDVSYTSLTEIQQQKKLLARVISTYFGQQGQSQWYSFTGTEIFKDEKVGQFEDDENTDNSDPDEKKYSSKFGGDFTDEELAYLNKQYDGALKDYGLKTTNDFEYAMNVAVAGLIVRKTRKDYLNGVVGADKKYKESVAIYDSLCSSAKLNQKTRSNNDVAGLGSLSEIVAKLEQTGFLQKKIIFEKDDVDKINADMRHVLVSLSGDS